MLAPRLGAPAECRNIAIKNPLQPATRALKGPNGAQHERLLPLAAILMRMQHNTLSLAKCELIVVCQLQCTFHSVKVYDSGCIPHTRLDKQ